MGISTPEANPVPSGIGTRMAKKLKLMYYIYTVTLPIYGMQPIEKAIIDTFMAFFVFLVLHTAFWVFGIPFWAALALVGVPRGAGLGVVVN